MRSTKSIQLACVAVAATMAFGSVSAAEAIGTLSVSALVVQTCVVVATPLVMGSYTAADLTVPGLITVTCTAGNGTYQIGLGKGVNGNSVTDRKLKSSLTTDTLNYGLFRDSGYTANWGETLNTDTQPSSAGVGALIKTFPVYAKIGAGQSSPAGLYADSVVVTVTY